MLKNGLSANGDALFNHNFGFVLSEGIALEWRLNYG